MMNKSLLAGGVRGPVVGMNLSTQKVGDWRLEIGPGTRGRRNGVRDKLLHGGMAQSKETAGNFEVSVTY